MKIAIHEIPEEGLFLSFSSTEWLPESIRASGDVAANLVLYNRGSRILVEGTLRLQTIGCCDRCLCEMLNPVIADFTMNLERVEELDCRGEHFLAQDELDTEFIDGEEIDLNGILQQQLYLSLPVKQLCKESCLGLCSKCGKDLNKESCHCSQGSSSPFSSLAGFLKKS